MAEPARDLLLVAVAIGYLAGAVLMAGALTRVVLTWRIRRRTRRGVEPVPPGHLGDPGAETLRQIAATAMAAVAARVNVTTPTVDVAAVLGVPQDGPEPAIGDGGLAVTRFRVGRPPTVVFARPALTELSPAALRSLAAHELAHVIRRERSSVAGPYVWLAGYLLLMLLGFGLSATALVAAPQWAALAVLATLATALTFLGLQVAFDRREELAADRFAIDLTRDLDAAAELMGFLDKHVARPCSEGRVRRTWARVERRWFATHPEPAARLAAMRRHLVAHQGGR